MLSLLALSIDRYQTLAKPDRKRFSMQVVLPIIWVISLATVVPYTAFISHVYLDVIKNIDLVMPELSSLNRILVRALREESFVLLAWMGACLFTCGCSSYFCKLFYLVSCA